MSESTDRGVVLALGSLAVGAFVFVFAEMRVAINERTILKGQTGQVTRRLRDMKPALQKVEDALQRRTLQLKKAEDLEAMYEGLLTELIELAKVDPAARLIVQKWKIQHDAADSVRTGTSDSKPGSDEAKGK